MAKAILPDVEDLSSEDVIKLLKMDKLNLVRRAGQGKPLTREQRGILEAMLDGEERASTTVQFAPTKTLAAKLLKCSRSSLDDWIKKMKASGMSPVRSDNEIDLVAIRRYRRSLGAAEPTEIAAEEMEELQKLRSQLLIVKLEREQLALAQQRGEMLEMSDMVKQTAEAFGAIRYLMLARWDTLAVEMAGHTVPDIKRRGRASDTEILMQFSGGDWPHEITDAVKKFLLWMEVNLPQ